MAKRQDPPTKKPDIVKALNLSTNSEGRPLSPYYERLLADNLRRKDTEAMGLPKIKDAKQARAIVRDLYANDVDVAQLSNLPDRKVVARQSERNAEDSGYYTAPERGFLPMFTEEYSQTLNRIASGVGKLYAAATEGVDGLKRIREFEKGSGVFDYGARHNAMLASDDFSMGKLGRDLGAAMGQISVQVPAAAAGTLAAGPIGGALAAGAVTAPFSFGSAVDEALENGIADNHVIPYATAFTGLITALESAGFGALTKSIGVNKIVSETMQEATKKGLLPFGKKKLSNELSETLLSQGADINKDVLGGLFKSAKNRMIDRISAGAIIKGATPEGAEEFISAYAESASKLFYDSNFGAGTAGKGKFGMDREKIASWSQFKDALYGGAIGMIAGSPVAAVSSATQPVYKTGLFHAFDGTIRNGGSIADAVNYINQSLDRSAGATNPDKTPLYTPEQVQQAKSVVERAARTYERVGNKIQDPGFRFMVFNRIGEIDSLNEKSQALQAQKQSIEQAIASGQADLSIYSTDIKEIDNEINRIAEVVQYDTAFVTQAVNQYFDRELSMSQAMAQLADSGVDDVIANLPANLTPDAMVQFLRDTESSWKQGRTEIEARYATPVQVGINTESEVSQGELDQDFEVMQVSLPSGPSSTGSYTIARRIEEDPNTGDPIESFYTVSDPTQSVDMTIRGLRKIPRAKIYQDRLNSAFEARPKFESVARSIASGSTLTQEETDIYDDYKAYIDPIVAQLEQSETDVANSALESSVRATMLEGIDKDIEVYDLAQKQIEEIDKALEPYAEVDPETLTKGQQELLGALQERRNNLAKLITSYDDAVASVTTDGLIDPLSLMDTNPVAYRLFMKMKEEFDALREQAVALMSKRNKKDEDRTNLAKIMERLKQFPGFEISYVQLQKEVELREKIGKLVTEAKVTSDSKKMKDLVALSIRREQLQKQLESLQKERNNKTVSQNASKIQGIIDAVLKSKTQVNSLTANQQRMFDAAIAKIEPINPDLAAELRGKVEGLFAAKLNQEVDDKIPTIGTPPQESGGVQSDTGVLPVDSGAGQSDATQQDNSGEVQGGGQQADTGTTPVPQERSGGQNTPQGATTDTNEGSQVPTGGVEVVTPTPALVSADEQVSSPAPEATQDQTLTQEANVETNQEAAQEPLLEQLPDGGQETQGGQDGPQLRPQEEVANPDQPIAETEPLDDTVITQEEQNVQSEIDQIDQQINDVASTPDNIPQAEIDRATAETRVESEALDAELNPTTTAGRLRALARSLSSEARANKLAAAAQELDSGVQAVVNMKAFKKGAKNPFFLDTEASLNTQVFQALASLGLSRGGAGATPIIPGSVRIIFDPKLKTYSIEFTPKDSTRKLSAKDLSVSDLTVLLTNNDGSPLSIFERNEDGSLIDSSQYNANTNTDEDLRDITSFVSYLSTVFPSLNVQILNEAQWVEKGFSSISDGAFDESGAIYLRRDYATKKTLVHEMGHVIVHTLKNSTEPMAKDYYNALVRKVKSSKYYDRVKAEIPAATEDVYIDEAIAYAIQDMGVSLSKGERVAPKSQNQSLSKKNFFELVQGAGKQILKAIGISTSKDFSQLTIDEMLSDIATVAVGSPDKAALANYLDLRSVGKHGSGKVLNSLFENFKRQPHHGDAASIKPPGYFAEFHKFAKDGGTTVNDAREFFTEIINSGVPKSTVNDGLTMVKDNPAFAIDGKVPNVKLFDRLMLDPAFLDDFINDYVDLINGIDIDSAPRTGIPSSTLLDNVDKMSASYHKWYSDKYVPIVENRGRSWARVDVKEEAKLFANNIRKISNPAGYDTKTKLYGRLVKAITGSSVSQFMNFTTLSKIFGGLMTGIEDMRIMNNEEASRAKNEGMRSYDDMISKLDALRKERGMSYDVLNEDVNVEFYDNMGSSSTAGKSVERELTAGQAMSIWMTHKSQVAYHRKMYTDKIASLNDLIRTRESEIAALRSKSPVDKSKIKSIEKIIKSAQNKIETAQNSLLTVDTMSSVFYDSTVQSGKHGSRTLIDNKGNLENRGFTLSYTAGDWILEPSSGVSGTKNDYNILMTKDQLDKLRDMFEGRDDKVAPYGKEFDLVWGFYNNENGKKFFGRVNEVHYRLTGKYAEFLEDGYYHTRAYSGISTNERTIGASADSLRYIMERKGLPARVIGIDVLSQAREYIEQNTYYMENAEVATTLHNVMQQIPSDKLADTNDGAFNDRVNQYYQSLKNAHESMRDHPQRRNRAMKEMRLMGIKGSQYNWFMRNFARSVFAFNLAVPFKQLGTLLNLIGSSDLIDTKHIWSVAPFMLKEGFRSYKSLASTEGGRLDKMLGIPKSLVESEVEWMINHEDKGFSTILARIYDQTSNTQGVDIGEIGRVGIPKNKGALGTASAIWANFGETVDKYGMEPMRRNDRVVIIGIVMAAKKQVQENINRGLPDYVAAGATDMNSDYAIGEVARIATEMTYKSNNMNMVNDKTPVQNSVDLITRAISLFSSQPQKIFNSLKQSGIEAAQADFKDEALNRVFVMNLVQGVVAASVYQAVITTVWDIMKNGYDEEEDYQKNIMIDTSRSILGLAPSFWTQFGTGVISTFDNKPWNEEVGGTVMFDVANDALKSVQSFNEMTDETKPEYIREREHKKFIVGFTNTMSRVMGAPITLTSWMRREMMENKEGGN